LNRLKELPAELNEEKFKDLTESAKVSKFSKREFEVYRDMYHKIWDHNAMRRGIFKEFAEDINAKIEDRTREIAKNLIKLGVSDEKIVAATGLSLEDVVVLRSQLEV
jgi:hypothetical protein